MGTSIDGFVAGPDDQIDVYPLSADHLRHMAEALPEVLPTHVREAMAIDASNRRFDTVIQGRRSYRLALDVGFTSPNVNLEQLVASTTLSSPDLAVTTVRDPVATVRDLKTRPGSGIYSAGGGTLAGALADEIEELVVKVYPVLLGDGRPEFTAGFSPRAVRARRPVTAIRERRRRPDLPAGSVTMARPLDATDGE